MSGQLISQNPDSSTMLAPSGPSGGLVCRYSGLNWKGQLHLLASARLTAFCARHLAALLSHLPVGPSGTVVCPRDDASADIIVLGYPHQASAMVQVSLSGCGTVTNGWFGRGSDPALTGALQALVGIPSPVRP